MIPHKQFLAGMRLLDTTKTNLEKATSVIKIALEDVEAAKDKLAVSHRRMRKQLLLCMLDKPEISVPNPPSESDYVTKSLIEKAVETALDEWDQIVKEPPGEGWERIDGYIRDDLGLGWASADASNLSEPIPYTKNGQFAWCGAFQAWCWGNAGLRKDIRYSSMASLYRIHKFAHGTKRFINPEDIKRGDVVCMGEVDGPDHGQHMAMALADFRDDYVITLEGNAHGEGPYGDYCEGVVQRQRPVLLDNNLADDSTYYVKYGVRFLMGDTSNE